MGEAICVLSAMAPTNAWQAFVRWTIKLRSIGFAEFDAALMGDFKAREFPWPLAIKLRSNEFAELDAALMRESKAR
jgi:hypothetical protein